MGLLGLGLLQNRFYHLYASSSNINMCNNPGRMHFSMNGSGRDTEGRVAYIKTLINGSKIMSDPSVSEFTCSFP